MSKKTATKKPAAQKGASEPLTVEGITKLIAAQEKILQSTYFGSDKYDAATAKLVELRAQLDLAEVRELKPPSIVTTDFEELDVEISAIVITGNHREDQDQAALERLANSLKTQRLQQRIGVRRMGAGKFELIFGSRRTAAAKLAGWKYIPAKVYAEDLTPAQVEILRSIEDAHALAEVESPAAMFPKVKSLAWDGRRFAVLGTKLIRGVECWQLAELMKSDKSDLRGEDATTAAAAGNFDGIGVIDAADGNKRRRICFDMTSQPCPVIYVRADAERAEAEAA